MIGATCPSLPVPRYVDRAIHSARIALCRMIRFRTIRDKGVFDLDEQSTMRSAIGTVSHERRWLPMQANNAQEASHSRHIAAHRRSEVAVLVAIGI